MSRRTGLLLVLCFVAFPLLVVSACGPNFEPDVFVPKYQPHAPERFARGELGVLQPGYWIAEKVVAFRYLNGGRLDEEEQRQWKNVEAPLFSTPELTGVDRWKAARAASGVDVLPWKDLGQEISAQFVQGNLKQEYRHLNCPNAAFDKAVATLAERRIAWGEKSDALKDWIAAQDAVFSNCSSKGAMPPDAAAGAPLLLQQDRTYQRAAAMFYAGDYVGAEAAFAAIAKDTTSPWSNWGEYLAARAMVRRAAMTGAFNDPYNGKAATFDVAVLQAARERLIAVLHGTKEEAVRHAAQAEINFIQIRLAPEERVRELALTLGGRERDAEFGQHLIDFRFLLDQGKTGDAPLVQWMGKKGYAEAIAHWKSHRDLPWLILALQTADSADPELLAAAASVPERSPGYVTAQYHRARLMTLKDPTGAREVVTHVLPAAKGDAASTNALLALRMQTARTLEEILQDAPREVLNFTSESAMNAGCVGSKNCSAKSPVSQIDQDAAEIFDEQMPLSLWLEAAVSQALPEHLRRDVVLAGWMRAVLLQDADAAKRFSALLPPEIRAIAGNDVTFHAALASLRSPGLRPYLEQGVQRVATYNVMDEFRDNWWCTVSTDRTQGEDASTILPRTGKALFLTETQRAQAKKEFEALQQKSNGAIWNATVVSDWVTAHPEEKDGAEALALAVRATHFGCFPKDEAPKKAASKRAFTLLHAQYPNSKWATETKYYY
ncbi:hypothetical protein [Terriglobus saanensis]|nr:hypothetical protein [Terriglobus saanensis]